MLTFGLDWPLFLGSALWLFVLPLLVDRLLRALKLQRPNFRGETIPVAYGLVVLLWSAPVVAVIGSHTNLPADIRAAYLVVIMGLGALGFADDLWGDRSVTGLRGHLRAFIFERRVTTGFVKAVGGAGLALGVTRFVLKQSWPEALLDGAIIALCANALNLLDLRPGRACAAFLAGSIVLLAAGVASGHGPDLIPLFIVLIPTLVVYERDARAKAMLGDTGSNLLGGSLGLAFVLSIPSVVGRSALLASLMILHVVAERYSLSAVIERDPLLRRLDRLTGSR